MLTSARASCLRAYMPPELMGIGAGETIKE